MQDRQLDASEEEHVEHGNLQFRAHTPELK
jgi:hypothetical protein